MDVQNVKMNIRYRNVLESDHFKARGKTSEICNLDCEKLNCDNLYILRRKQQPQM